MTSKQRAYLNSLAHKEQVVVQIGKAGLTPDITESAAQALAARELIKCNVQKNCLEEPRQVAQTLSERTRSQVVQVIGRKFILYKESKEHKKIELPR